MTANPCDDRGTVLADLEASETAPGSSGPGNGEDIQLTVSAGAALCGAIPPIVRLHQRQQAVIHVVLADVNGVPIGVEEGTTLTFVVKERPEQRKVIWQTTCDVEDNGTARVEVPVSAFKIPGIFYGQLQYRKENSSGIFAASNYTIYVEPTLGAQLSDNAGMVTIMDVRMFVMDACAEKNMLIGALEFSDEDIVYALRRAVGEFNETNVPITNYTPHRFPFRTNLVKGASGYLLRSAAARYARNQLDYRAGDVSIDDQNKAQSYLSIAGELLGGWHEFCVTQKVRMNMERGWGVMGSPYRGV